METYAARAPPGRALFRARISTPRHLAVFVPARLRESPAVNLARAARFPGRGSSHAPRIPLKRFQMHFQKLFLPMNADAALQDISPLTTTPPATKCTSVGGKNLALL